MITLAIECATDTVGLALLDGRDILADFYLGQGRHRAEVVLPALEKLLLMAGITMEQIDLLACTTGPGSFTGVRIGVSSVKGLALATGKPIVGISTLEALSMNAFPSSRFICPLIDAQRNQVYAGLYKIDPDGFPESVSPDRLTDIVQLERDLPVDDVELIGNGALRYRERLLEFRTGLCDPKESRRHRLHASNVGLIGIHRYYKGQGETPLTFSPKYFRFFDERIKNAT